MSTVTGFYTDIGLVPLNGRAPQLRFVLEGGPAFSIVGGRVLSRKPVTVIPDTRGYFTVDLIANDEISGRTSYRVVAEYLGANGSPARSIDVLSGLYVTGVGGPISAFLPGAQAPGDAFPSNLAYSDRVSIDEARAIRVPRNTDLAASLTPDGRTRVALLSGQVDQVYDNFTGGNGWTAVASQAADAARVKAGTASRRLSIPAAGTYACRFTSAKTFPVAALLQMWLWIDDPSKLTTVVIRPCNGWTQSSNGPFQPGWNLLRWRASSGTLTNWGTVDFVQLTFVTTGAVGINIGEAWVECPPKGQILFIEDRGYKTFKDIGVPMLRAIKVPITWALDPALNGSNPGDPAEAITDADVALFYSQGDDMSIHAYAGEVTATMTAQQIIDDARKGQDWLVRRGYVRGRQWRAAWTQNDAPRHAAAQTLYGAYASPLNLSSSYESWPPENPFNIGRWVLHGKTNAQIDALFDVLAKTNQLVLVYTHGIHDSLSGAVTNATWNYFMSKLTTAVSAGTVEGVTFTQLLARSGGIVR